MPAALAGSADMSSGSCPIIRSVRASFSCCDGNRSTSARNAAWLTAFSLLAVVRSTAGRRHCAPVCVDMALPS